MSTSPAVETTEEASVKPNTLFETAPTLSGDKNSIGIMPEEKSITSVIEVVCPSQQNISIDQTEASPVKLNTSVETQLENKEKSSLDTKTVASETSINSASDPKTSEYQINNCLGKEKPEVVNNAAEQKMEITQETIENADSKDKPVKASETNKPGQELPIDSVDSNKTAIMNKEMNDFRKVFESNVDLNFGSEETVSNCEVGPTPANKKDTKEESQEQNDAESCECVNVQELTEHVMNILNDGVIDDVLTEQQLLKKNVDLQQFIVKLIQLLKEKTDLCANLDRQNAALISQAKSLKDVIAITKDLLGIRNMEIEHLHADMTAMEDTIKEERTRQNLSVQRLSEAMSLNDKLKTEYLNQMDLFKKLREKYNEKVVHLTRENQRLNGILNPNEQIVEANSDETNSSDLDTNQIENVDK